MLGSRLTSNRDRMARDLRARCCRVLLRRVARGLLWSVGSLMAWARVSRVGRVRVGSRVAGVGRSRVLLGLLLRLLLSVFRFWFGLAFS